MGCPGATIVFEELVQLGCKKLIRVGTCGGLQAEPRARRPDRGAVRGPGRLDRDAPRRQRAPLPDGVVVAAPRGGAHREAQRPASSTSARSSRATSSTTPTRASTSAGRRAASSRVEMEAAALFTVAAIRASRRRACSPSATCRRRRRSRAISDEELRAAVDRMTQLALDVAVADMTPSAPVGERALEPFRVSEKAASSSSTRRARTARPAKRWPKLRARAQELGLDGDELALRAAGPSDRARARGRRRRAAARRRRRRRDAERGRQRHRGTGAELAVLPNGTGPGLRAHARHPDALRRGGRASRSTGRRDEVDLGRATFRRPGRRRGEPRSSPTSARSG